MKLDLVTSHRPLTDKERSEVTDLPDTLGKVSCTETGPQGYLCTREKGHTGLHVAQGSSRRVFEVFTDEEAIPF